MAAHTSFPKSPSFDFLKDSKNTGPQKERSLFDIERTGSNGERGVVVGALIG
jgi:hypothetical protein